MASKDIADIYFKIGVDDRPLQEGLDNAGKKTSRFGDILKANLVSAAIEKGIGALVSGFQKIGQAIEQNIGSAVSRLDTLNTYIKTMEALGYSTEDATRSQKKLSDAIDGLPTTLDGIVNWQQQFTALNGNIDKATDLTIALNNATLAAGKGQEEANRAMFNWYTMLANGVPDLQHWRSAYAVMPAQMEQLAKSMLGAEASAEDLLGAWKRGTVTTEQIEKAFVSLNKNGVNGLKSFADQAQIGAQTISTAYTNIGTAVTKNIAKVLDVFNGDATKSGGRIVTMLLNVKAIINNIGTTIANFVKEHEPQIAKFADAFNSLLKGENVAGNIKTMFDSAATVIKNIFTNISTFMKENAGGIIDTFVKIFTDNIPTIVETSAQILVAVVNGISAGLPKLIPAVVDMINLIVRTIIQNTGPLTDAAITITLALVNGLIDAFPKILEAIPELTTRLTTQVILNLPKILVAVGKIIVAVAKGIITAIPTIIKSVKTSFDAIVDELGRNTSIGEAVANIIDKVVTFFKNAKTAIVTTVGGWIQGIGDALANAIDFVVTKVTEFFKPVVDTLTSIWNGFVETFGPLLEAFKELFSTIFQAIGILTQRGMDAIKAKVTDAWNAVVNFFKPAVEAIGNVVKKGFELVKTYVITPIKNAYDKVKSVWDDIKLKISTTVAAAYNAVKEKFENLRAIVSEKLTSVFDKVKEVWGNVKDTIMGVVNKAKEWGADLIKNFIQGIKDNVKKLSEAVKGLAKKIKDMVGFSEPKEGPLSNFHTYAPDMIDLFVKGIKDNKHKLQNALNSIAELPSEAFGEMAISAPSGTARGRGNVSYNLTANIYASEGQDIRALAKEVSREIKQMIDDKEKAYA